MSAPLDTSVPPADSAAAFRAVMGNHYASVCLITTRLVGLCHGLTATAVSSVSADPPMLLVCVNRAGETQAAIRAAGRFCVNILGDGQEALAQLFAGSQRAARQQCFAGPDWRTLATGAPVHAGAVAAIDCTVAEAIDQGSHTIFIGAVAASWEPRASPPLLYGRRGFHRLMPNTAADA